MARFPIHVVAIAASIASACASPPPAANAPTLVDAWKAISAGTFVDLTHAFGPGIPHWKGFPDEKRETLYWYDASIPSHGTGFFAQSFTHPRRQIACNR